MGGEGPYVRFFEEDLRLRRTSTRPPPPLHDKQLNEAYTRAHPFLLERVRQLVQLGWEQHTTDGAAADVFVPPSAMSLTKSSADSLLASLGHNRVLTTYYGDRQTRVELQLPRTASALFDPSLAPRWKRMFENWELFDVRRRRGSGAATDRYADAYLYVDAEAPLRDIFNFFQCLVPDVLVIIRVDDIDDLGKKEITQRLPSSKWVEDYAAQLRPIFGEEGFKSVAQASQDRACLSQWLSSYMDYEDECEMGDFTACDKECGYCGKCPY